MPKRTAHIFEDKWRSDDVKQQEAADFSSLLLSERVLVGLKKAGFKTPSPIQLEAIPVGRVGSNLLVQAKSGTGKTLVFTIIALDLLLKKKEPQVLILAPTREIAFQICDVVRSVGCAFDHLKCHAFIGGIPIESDLQNIQGCQIIVGTPGRIRQLMSLNILKPGSVRMLVFDEADQLLDKSFQPEIESIFVSLSRDVQIIATSATYPKTLQKLLTKYFKHDPYVARLNMNDLALLGMMHYARSVEVSQMPVLASKMKMRALEDVLTSVTFSQCLVFCNSISKVEPICDNIKNWGFSATYISSAKEQAARLKAIECLKRFKCKVLVSSDVTSRGIDAENVDLIINIDVPYTTEVYLHRVGRAGRFGSKGVAITFVSTNEMPSFKRIQKNGNFKPYILPDPIPANLINLRPGPDLESIEVEDSVSESSEEETIIPDNIPSDSSIKMHKIEHASNGTGDGAAPIESQVLHLNTLNAIDSSIENDAFADIRSQICSSFRMFEDSCKDESADKSSEHKKDVRILIDALESLKNRLNTLNPLCSSHENSSKDNEEQMDSQLADFCMSENCCKGELTDKLLKKYSEPTKEVSVNRIMDEVESLKVHSNIPNSLFSSRENALKDDEDQLDSQLADISMSDNSCNDDSLDKLLVSLEQSPVSKIHEALLQIPDNDSIGYNSSSSESPGKSEIGDPLKNPQVNQIPIDVIVNEVSNEIFIKNVNEVEVCSLSLEDKTTDPSDIGVRVLTDATSVDIGGEKCELNVNVELKSDIYSEVVGQNSIDKTVEASCSPVARNMAVNPIQVDELTVSVMKFIDDYEKKNTALLYGDTIAEKTIQATSSNTKCRIDELALDRMSLHDYYYEVFEAYRNYNIAGDPSEILELIKNQNEMSHVEENHEKGLVVETEENVIPIAGKIDLNSWSMKLGNVNLNGVGSDSTDESGDSSSECILVSTPVKAFKAKNIQLDVSSDTPSFLNPIDDPETDDSASSKYSNKCLRLENALKNKIGTVNKSPKYSSDTEETSSSSDTEDTSSSSDTGSSSCSKDSAEATLLERACRVMAKTNPQYMTLAEKANMLKRALLDLESNVHTAQKSNGESLSDIQISTAAHPSKVHGNDRASNDKCGSRSLLQHKTKESYAKSPSSLSSLSSIGSSSVAKRSTRGRRSSIRSCSSGKSVNTFQGKYRQFSLSGQTSSSESSISCSGRSTCSEEQKGSKSQIHSRDEKLLIQCSHAKGYAGADESNYHSNHTRNPRHVNDSYFNPQGGFARSAHPPTHEHSDTCYQPSQHQSHNLDGHLSCQSQSCADWYSMFYSQWYSIQHSSHFQ